MTIDNNMNSMISSSLKIEQSARNIADIASAVGSPELQEVSSNLLKEITSQIPEIIAYEANAEGIKTQNAIADTLLNIKA
jgi:hypothetical protein